MPESITRERWHTIQPLLDGALELEPAARFTWLTQRCGGDAELMAAVERLLAAFEGAQAVLPSGGPEAVVRLAGAEASATMAVTEGSRIGPYRIVGEAGRGGMGVVYLAERADDQYRKRVALKLLRRGMDDPHLVRRFLEERQILATLDHPQIAKLLDGGVTGDRLPWFAMEYVEGEPIDRYCDRRRLTVDQRLRLFLAVCDAVQYAHRNLVVHRDLKPSNVMVTADGQVKLLDFGIAKLLAEGDGTAATLTEIGRRAMTPEYASPEQVRGEPVTITSDVYTLGVMLYALLSGQLPYQLRSHRERDVERAVLQDAVTAPSAAARRPDVAAARGTSPDRLERRLRGDLDMIALTALRKEAERRYPSVEALAADVGRHLDGLPVEAQPDRWTYRAAKFVRRHAVGVGAAGAVALLLAVFAGIAAVQWARAVRERDRAEQVSTFVTDLLRSPDPYDGRGEGVTVKAVLDSAVRRIQHELPNQPSVQADLLTVMGQSYNGMGLLPEAEAALDSSIAVRIRSGDRGPGLPKAQAILANAMVNDPNAGSSESVARAAVANADRAFARDDEGRADVLTYAAASIGNAGHETEADSLLVEAVRIYRLHSKTAPQALSEALGVLGDRKWHSDRWFEAETLWTEARRLLLQRLPPEHIAVGQLTWALGLTLGKQGKLGAERYIREGLAVMQRSGSPTDPDLLYKIRGLAEFLIDQGQLAPAESLYREIAARSGQATPPDHRLEGAAVTALASITLRRGDTSGAIATLDSALRVSRQTVAPDQQWAYAIEMMERGTLATARRDYAVAERLLLDALDARRRHWGDASPAARDSREALVHLYQVWGKPALAQRYQSELGAPAAPAADAPTTRASATARDSAARH